MTKAVFGPSFFAKSDYIWIDSSDLTYEGPGGVKWTNIDVTYTDKKQGFY